MRPMWVKSFITSKPGLRCMRMAAAMGELLYTQV